MNMFLFISYILLENEFKKMWLIDGINQKQQLY